MPGIGEIAVAILAGLGKGELQRRQTQQLMERQSRMERQADENRQFQKMNVFTRILEAAQQRQNPELFNYAAGELEGLTGQKFNYREPEKKKPPQLYNVPEQYRDIYGDTPVELDDLNEIIRTQTGVGREERLNRPGNGRKTDKDNAAKFQLETLEDQMKRAQDRGDSKRYAQLIDVYLKIGNSGQAVDPQTFNALVTDKPLVRSKADVRSLLRQQGLNVPEPSKGATKQQRQGKLKQWYE